MQHLQKPRDGGPTSRSQTRNPRLGYTLPSGGVPLLEVAKSILLILSALFRIVNPLGVSPVFLAVTRDYPRSDWFGACSAEHLCLLRFRRSPRRHHWRERHEHYFAALFFSPRLHRRPDLLERSQRPDTVSLRRSLSEAEASV